MIGLLEQSDLVLQSGRINAWKRQLEFHAALTSRRRPRMFIEPNKLFVKSERAKMPKVALDSKIP